MLATMLITGCGATPMEEANEVLDRFEADGLYLLTNLSSVRVSCA